MSQVPRKRLFVDPPVQGALLVRCLINWVFCVSIAAMLLLCWSVLTNPGHSTFSYLADLWAKYRALLGISVVLMLIAMIDFVRLSNRFCGPIVRLRNDMRRIAEGEKVAPIEFRDGDYWQEIADSFNQMASKVQALSSDSQQPQ